MRAGNDNQISRRGLNSQIEGTPKCEFYGGYMYNPAAKGFRQENRSVCRSRIHKDDLHIPDCLLPNPFQQTSDMSFFVRGADNNGTVHTTNLNFPFLAYQLLLFS